MRQDLLVMIIKILQSCKNGFIYGARLRFAHSLVISLLFKPQMPLYKRLKQVSQNSLRHGEILVVFLFIYKSLLLSLKKVSLLQGNHISDLIGGLVGGWVVYSGVIERYDNNISHQITLYCGSRVMLGIGKKLAIYLSTKDKKLDHKKLHHIENRSWMWYSTLSWGLVMYLYQSDTLVLQKSLIHSMNYIYENDKSQQVKDFINYLLK